MKVYAGIDNMIVWSDNNKTHKAGRVPLHETMEVIKRTGEWYSIERPFGLSLPPDSSYPDYWVEVANCVDMVSDPPGPSMSINDAEFLAAVKTVIRWLTQAF